MKKVVMLVCLATAITGCAPLAPEGCQKKTALDSCSYKQSGKVSDKDIYGQQAAAIKKALDSALADPHAWNGKRCNMHLDFTVDGLLQNLEIKGGDKAYCQALADAATRATFPPFIDERVFQDMGSARWNMEGQP